MGLWGLSPRSAFLLAAVPSSGGVAESPCRRAVKVLGEVFAAVLEFVPDEADPVEVGPHGELFVFHLRLFRACGTLCQCLMVEGKGEDNVAPDFACVEGAVEPSQLDRAVSVEEAVEVEKMVAAVVVVGVSRSVVAVVPKVLDGFEVKLLMLYNPQFYTLAIEALGQYVDLFLAQTNEFIREDWEGKNPAPQFDSLDELLYGSDYFGTDPESNRCEFVRAFQDVLWD